MKIIAKYRKMVYVIMNIKCDICIKKYEAILLEEYYCSIKRCSNTSNSIKNNN